MSNLRPYDYTSMKKELLFNKLGIEMVVKAVRAVDELLRISGSCTIEAVLPKLGSGSSYRMLAALDFLAEIDEIEIIDAGGWSQDKIIRRKPNR